MVVGVLDPDPRTNGAGVEALRRAGIEVNVGVVADKVEAQLAPYLHQRRTGRPFVVLKLASSLDGYTAAPDGSSKWITGPASRSDGHRLRAESDAIIVGAGTVRSDDPNLTVRDWQPPTGSHPEEYNPTRVVLGEAPEGALVHPCLELSGDPDEVLAELANRGMIQVLIEGARRLPGPFIEPVWSTVTCCTWRPPCLVATTPAACSPGRASGASVISGGASWCRLIAWATTCASSWRRRRTRRATTSPPMQPSPKGPDAMFTGIVEELGTLVSRRDARIRIGAALVLEDASLGDSIAVNGCCLTVVARGDEWWEADLSPETLERTGLVDLVGGDRVNLERPLRLADRLGGHLVQGHVDATAEVLAPVPDLRVSVPEGLGRYLVAKGSITVDGVSLTVAELDDTSFTVAVIPHTSEVTNLGGRRVGDRVNLEVDVVAKYVESMLAGATNSAGSTSPERALRSDP